MSVAVPYRQRMEREIERLERYQRLGRELGAVRGKLDIELATAAAVSGPRGAQTPRRGAHLGATDAVAAVSGPQSGAVRSIDAIAFPTMPAPPTARWQLGADPAYEGPGPVEEVSRVRCPRLDESPPERPRGGACSARTSRPGRWRSDSEIGFPYLQRAKSSCTG